MAEDKKETKDTKKKDMKWFTKFFSKEKLKKPNRVAVLYLRNNGNANLLDVETKDGFFQVGGRTYHESKDCVYTVSKDRIPLLVVREWDLIPLGTKKYDDDEMREKFAELEQHVLKGIRAAEMVKSGIGLDSKMTTKQMIMWGVIAIILVSLALNYI